MSKLINLHINTEYSLLESTIKIDSLISYAQENELDTLTITDHNVMYGVGEFVSKCKKANIKPIIGLDLDVSDYRLILLAKNYDGYNHLMKLSSKKIRGEEITIDDLIVTDIFIIDHPVYGYFQKKGEALVINNYFVGLSSGELPNGVAVNNIKIMKESGNKALSILNSIKEGKLKEFNEWPMEKENENLTTNMILQAATIASECNVIFPHYNSNLPSFETPDHLSAPAFLKQLVSDGAKQKLQNISKLSDYSKRIKYEVEIIEKLGFSDYFLIIWDLVVWAKSKGISVGPGRGSAAGSMVSYLLGITDVDPVKFGLLFERFLNPERVSMPDIDIDIQDNRRDEVVKYMFDKYGEDHVALIITYSKLGAKMALRDSARALNILPREVDQLSKQIKVGETLSSTYKNVASFRAYIEREPKFQELFEYAKLIEGLPRNVRTHAAGIVLSDKPIIESVPTTVGQGGYNQTQFSMDYMEINGLLKIDILGLRNLTIIQDIQKEVFNNYDKKVMLDKINLNDKLTNELLSQINTNGVFQLESYGMKRTLAQVGVDSFGDVAAVISLFRPGPMIYIETYANRKKGIETIPSISPEYDLITKDTYGIIIYQEQIMEIAQKFAGMSFGQSDILRRAISKKKMSLILGLKELFIKGALAKGQDQEKIDKVYKAIEAFAQYGFNKSHAIAYSIITYRLAFLKARFPLEFYTTILNASLDSQKAVQTYINEAKTKHIKITAPSINKSEAKVFNKNQTIIMPLKLIKGFGAIAQEKLLLERETNGLYENLFTFVVRVKIAGIGNSTIQSLIEANALRKFGNMQTLLDSLPSAIRYSEMITFTKDGSKVIDFNLIAKPRLVKAEQNINQEIAFEKKLLGMNYSVFYTDKYKTDESLRDLIKKDKITVAIYVDKIYKRKDKNNHAYASVLCHDSTNNIEFNIFASTWEFIDTSTSGKVYVATLVKRMFNGKPNYIMQTPWKEQHE